jgi:hypothetical protein
MGKGAPGGTLGHAAKRTDRVTTAQQKCEAASRALEPEPGAAAPFRRDYGQKSAEFSEQYSSMQSRWATSSEAQLLWTVQMSSSCSKHASVSS